jgi:hypothetical protein
MANGFINLDEEKKPKQLSMLGLFWTVQGCPESGRSRCSGRVGGIQSLDGNAPERQPISKTFPLKKPRWDSKKTTH